MDAHMQRIAAAVAAAMIDEGLEHREAARRALRTLGLPARTALPHRDVVDAAVREHIAIFCAQTQPRELAALRELALQWMQRLAHFDPLLGGAVWQGTATRRSDVVLHVFADDPKALEIALLDAHLPFDVGSARGLRAQTVDALHLRAWCAPLQAEVGLHLLLNDTLARRGAGAPDAQGRRLRGTTAQLIERMRQQEPLP